MQSHFASLVVDMCHPIALNNQARPQTLLAAYLADTNYTAVTSTNTVAQAAV